VKRNSNENFQSESEDAGTIRSSAHLPLKQISFDSDEKGKKRGNYSRQYPNQSNNEWPMGGVVINVIIDR